MARKVKFDKQELLEKTIDFIREKGIKSMNARDLCNYIGCSTQPVFKNFKNMEGLGSEIKKYIKDYYTNYTEKIVDKDAYLYTSNYSYTLFALEEPNLFEALFMVDPGKSKTIDEILCKDEDREIIETIPEQYSLSKKQSERLYRDIKFYTHGLSCQIACNNLSLKKEEIGALIRNMINNLRKEI